jgi:hypothetical protein
MTRNYPAWRDNIRRSYQRGISRIHNRGAWSNPDRNYVLPRADNQISGNAWWRHFGSSGSLRFSQVETFYQNISETSTFDNGNPPQSRTRIVTGNMVAVAEIPRDRIIWLYSVAQNVQAPPINSALRYHASATPYGEGLYDCFGIWRIFVQTKWVETNSDTFLPETNRQTTESLMIEYPLPYRTDWKIARLRGLNSKIKLQLRQNYHGPGFAIYDDAQIIEDLPGGANDAYEFTPIPFDPQEMDPEGNPGDEVYWANHALRVLANGIFSDQMDRISGNAARTNLDYDETSPLAGGSWSHGWTRSGILEIKFFRSASPPLP